jgi:hypothetical protein
MATAAMHLPCTAPVARAAPRRQAAAGAVRLPAAPAASCRAAALSARAAARGAALECRAAAPAAAGRAALCVRAGSLEAGVGVMGNKAGMTSYFTKEGLQVPVTVIALLAGNVVTQARARRRAAPPAPPAGRPAAQMPSPP